MEMHRYSPLPLELRKGYLHDSTDLSPMEREELRFEPDSVRALSKHLPLVTDFVWR